MKKRNKKVMRGIKVDIHKLKVGDIIIDNDGDIGFIFKKSRTLLHEHLYIKADFMVYDDCFGKKYSKCCFKFYEHENKIFTKLIIKREK